MQRGSQSLFADIFEIPTEKQSVIKKGRSSNLNLKRNECLIDRYYYYAAFTDKRYSKIIETVAEQFFLSPVCIPEIISSYRSHLTNLKKMQPSVKYFKDKWSHLNW